MFGLCFSMLLFQKSMFGLPLVYVSVYGRLCFEPPLCFVYVLVYKVVYAPKSMSIVRFKGVYGAFWLCLLCDFGGSMVLLLLSYVSSMF